MKKIIYVLILLCLLTCLTSCEPGKQYYTKTEIAMNTVVSLNVYTDNADEVMDAAFNRIEEIENLMSATIEGSDIYNINSQGHDSYVKVSDETIYVLKEALYIAEITDGYFDPTLGNLIDEWGIGTDDAKIPDDISQYVGIEGYKYVEINEEECTVKLNNDNIKLNLGAIVKGYAADEVKKTLEEYSVESALINLGGNIITIGEKYQDNNLTSKWKVGIQDPSDTNNVIKYIDVDADTAVVTSGDYERYFVDYKGNYYHHILDPFTGYSALTDIKSVTIVCESGIIADALSTSAFLIGVENTKSILNEMKMEIDVIFILKDGEIITV